MHEPSNTAVEGSTVLPTQHPSGITPTVGRVVYVCLPGVSGVRAADVVGVRADGTVDVQVKLNHLAGDLSFEPLNTVNVQIHNPNRPDLNELAPPYATWMPFQAGQAPSSAELLKRLAEVETALATFHASISGDETAATDPGANPQHRLAAIECHLKELSPNFRPAGT